MLTWDTLIFALPIAVAIVLGTGALSGLGEADIELDLDLDVDADADVDGEGEAEGHSWIEVLAWLGVGRAPIMVLLTVGLLAFGITGLLARLFVGPFVALGLALVVSPFATSATGRVLGRYMPTSETYALERNALVGCAGTARLAVTRSFGVAQVIDESGTLHEVRCRIDDTAAEGTTITKGGALVVVDYEDSSATYTVAALNHDALARPARALQEEV